MRQRIWFKLKNEAKYLLSSAHIMDRTSLTSCLEKVNALVINAYGGENNRSQKAIGQAKQKGLQIYRRYSEIEKRKESEHIFKEDKKSSKADNLDQFIGGLP